MNIPQLALLLVSGLVSSPSLSADETIAAPGAMLEKLWDEGEFTEGGVWMPDGTLLFSDIGNRIMRFDPSTKAVTTFREPSGRANGLILTLDGRLVAAEGANTGGGRRVSITQADGSVRSLAEGYQGKRFNSPNDLAVDSHGRVYVSDPRYVGDEPRELDEESVYLIDRDGSVERVETSAKKPNGLAISPDGKTLYVADNGPARKALLAVPLDEHGRAAGPARVLKDFGDGRGIDGMTVTTKGFIVAAAGAGRLAGIYVHAPDGTPAAFLAVPETPTNVEFGGPERKTLYITAGKSLYRIESTLQGYVPSALHHPAR